MKREEKKKNDKFEGEGAVPYIRSIREISDPFLGYKKLKNLARTENVSEIDGFFHVWTANEGKLNYLIREGDWDGRKPSVGVLTEKILVTLISYCIEQWDDQSNKIKATFTLDGLMEDLGYTEEETRKGGKRLAHVVNCLTTLWLTNYRKIEPSPHSDMLKITYRNFFDIDVEAPKKAVKKMIQTKRQIPTGRGVKITITINDTHRKALQNFKEHSGGKYFLVKRKLIRDRRMNDNISLFKLANYVYFTQGGREYPIGIRKLLNSVMHVGEKIVNEEPTRCFNYLRDSMAVLARDYSDSFAGIKMYDRQKVNWQWIGLSEIEKLPDINYSDFKDTTLELLGESDIRECFIAFCQEEHQQVIQANQEIAEVVQTDLAKRILQWVHKRLPYDKLDRITPSGTEDFIRNSIEKLGAVTVRLAFERELKKGKPDAYRLVVVTLTNMMKGQRALGLKAQRDQTKNPRVYGMPAKIDDPEGVVEIKAEISEIAKRMRA